jgi:hypothetical protein
MSLSEREKDIEEGGSRDKGGSRDSMREVLLPSRAN